jgi:hypothetical protein
MSASSRAWLGFGAGCQVVMLNESGFPDKLSATIGRLCDEAEALRPQLLTRRTAKSLSAERRTPGSAVRPKSGGTANGTEHRGDMEYHTLGVALRTRRCRWFGRTDVGLWADTAGFEDTWRGRARLIADLVPAGSRVVDFGAGRRVLESCLAGKATYIPHDVVSRGPDTMVFDLNNRPLPELTYLNLDVAVLAGVLEYVRDIGSFLRWLAPGKPVYCLL